MVVTTPCTSVALSSAASVYGGQGVDSDFSGWNHHRFSVGGNLGNDTLEFQDVVKGAAIYGGGGFEYDTSLDGADSISLGGSVQALWSTAMVVMTPSTSPATSRVPPFMAVKALTPSKVRLVPTLSYLWFSDRGQPR